MQNCILTLAPITNRLITEARNSELNLETEGIRKLAAVYHAIDHPVRMAILLLIHAYEPMSVMEISDKMQLEKEAVSQQLSVLRRAGLVYSTPRSRFRYYALNYEMLQRLHFATDQ